ncbi:LysR family transcriptional regulator [Brachybacterium sp. YJGR34]|uniref:LysR substrate-binding domain-containing protein n=1 Tax=Brachybacterium sp. YJGR34 TaxID=2059911 RepID=UPI000E0BD6A9|nr:LysR family transcriptional regulator [Brachybacterium sp. YJGR34]
MPRVDQTDWLETFVAVVDHGSFSGAARALHRSQSRVSTHVAALERALGGTLVDRSHRPVRPTELGTTFLPHARAVLEALERGTEAVELHSGTLRGRVVIGCHPSVSAGFLPAVLAAVHAAHPALRIELTEHTTQDLVSGIVSGRYHLAIHSSAGDPPPDDLQSVHLWTERYAALAPPGHPVLGEDDAARRRAAEEGIDPRRIAEHPLIAVAQPGEAVDPDTGSALRAWGLEIPVAWQTEQPQTVVNLAREGLGVGVLNALAAAVADTSGMAVVPVGTLAEGRRVAVTRDRRAAPSPSVDVVFQAILEATPPPGVRPAPPDRRDAARPA